MMRKTHLAIGVGAAMLAFLPTQPAPVAALAIGGAALGSVAPDWDLHLPIIKHRTLTHALYIPALLWMFVPGALGAGLALGWLLHILADCLTRAGVPLLWPLPAPHVRGPIVTNGWSEMLFAFVLVISTGGALWLYTSHSMPVLLYW